MRETPEDSRPSSATWVPSGDTTARVTTVLGSLPRLLVMGKDPPVTLTRSSWVSWVLLLPAGASTLCPSGKKEGAPYERVAPGVSSWKPLPSAFTLPSVKRPEPRVNANTMTLPFGLMAGERKLVQLG